MSEVRSPTDLTSGKCAYTVRRPVISQNLSPTGPRVSYVHPQPGQGTPAKVGRGFVLGDETLVSSRLNLRPRLQTVASEPLCEEEPSCVTSPEPGATTWLLEAFRPSAVTPLRREWATALQDAPGGPRRRSSRTAPASRGGEAHPIRESGRISVSSAKIRAWIRNTFCAFDGTFRILPEAFEIPRPSPGRLAGGAS